MIRFSPFSVGVVASILVLSAHGQMTSGNIAGVVKDATGAVVPNAIVNAKSEATGITVSGKTNNAGEYLLQNLLPASYDITVQAGGFAPTVLKAVPVTLNATATADVSVAPGSTATEVEVTANSVALDTTTQNLTQTFETQELSTLPVTAIGEGVLNASLLAPGVGSTGGIGIGVGPSVAGQRPRNNNFTIEGIDNNNKAVTGPLVYVPNDAVGEFTLITTQFSPEFGHSSGGQFNTDLISGTNKFHGKVYEYFRNRDLNAASGVAGGKVPNPRYDNNRYGGELGGPILHNKLFFFANYERNTIGQNATYYVCTPTAAGMSTISGFAGTPGFSQTNVQQYVKYVPVATVNGGAQADPNNPLACGANTLTLTSGAASGDGATQTGATQAIIPLGNYLTSAPYFTNNDALAISLDYTISSNDSFRARYIYNTTGTTDVANASDFGLSTFFTTIPYRYHLITLSEFHNFTPNLINEARIGFNRYTNTTPAGDFSYPGLDSFPNLTFYDQGTLQIGPDENAPQFTIQNLYQLTDNVSYNKGRQSIRLGFDGRKYISPQGFTQRARGDYEWSYLSDFLHDYAPDSQATAERSTGSHTYYGDQSALYGYVNDTWRATDKLTLNLGLRYEFTSVPVGERSQALNSAASVPGLIDFHAPQPSYTGFAPRVGIEYAPNPKTSIRLGYGLAYDVLFDNLGTLSFPPQYSTTQDVGQGSAPGYGTPGFLANGGLPPGTGSGTTEYCLTGTGGTTGVPCSPDLPTQRAATSAFLPDQVLPYSENYTLTIQRELSRGLTAEIGYVGDRGVHLPTQIRYNIQPKTNASNYLPTYVNGVAINGQGTSATTLAAINANSNVLPAFKNAGFTNIITSYQPYSESNYNGLIAALQGRLRSGLQVNLAYTWSKAMDDATAEVFATTLTPRRPQNPQCIPCDYSRSALDHTHRLTLEADYNLQPFKPNSNWLLRNIVGNWVIAPIYTYESPEYSTVLSGDNSLLTGDAAYVGRTIINPSGIKGTSSTVTPVTNANGDTVGYTADNPTAYYIQAAGGSMANASRNTLPGRPIDNLDASAFKKFSVHERYTLEFGAQALNVLNHAQYIPGSIDDVNAYSYLGLDYQTVGNSQFNQPQFVFNNNPRVLQLSAKFNF